MIRTNRPSQCREAIAVSIGRHWPGIAGLIVNVHFESYSAVSDALAAEGLVGQQTRSDQLIVSVQQGPVWPDRGNSFWLSRQESTWYLITWSPVCYRIPKEQDVVALARECVEVEACAMHRVPSDIVTRFGLHELDDEECERLFPSDEAR